MNYPHKSSGKRPPERIILRLPNPRWARSSKYPLPDGGASIPYYMGFFSQYGFHASRNVPGRHASHGCIRMFFEDAEWLHDEWVEVGTKAIIRKY